MNIHKSVLIPIGATLLLIFTSVSLCAAGVLEGRETWSINSPGISDTAEEQDGAGTAVAVADFNGDGFDDLAIGVPGAQSGNMVTGAGRVLLIHGSAGGLQADSHTYLDQTNTPGGIEQDDFFGSRLTTGDFNDDGHVDLAVGVPFEDVGLLPNAGEVDVFWGSENGLDNASVFVLNQALAWIPESPVINGFFGFSLAAKDVDEDSGDELAIGAPFDTRENGDAVGSVYLILGSFSRWTVNPEADRYLPSDIAANPPVAPVFGWAVALGDFYGPDQPGMVVGVPGFSLQTGRFDAFSPNPDDAEVFVPELNHSQGSNGDLFGFSVARYDNNNNGTDNVVIGAPGVDEAVNNILQLDVGEVRAWALNPLDEVGSYRPRNTSVAESAEADDQFGSTLHVEDVDGDGQEDLIVGVPEEDIEQGQSAVPDAGILHVFYGPIENTNRRQTEIDADRDGLNSTVSAVNAQLGFALAAGSFNGQTQSIAVGVPGEKLFDVDNAGSVTIFDAALFADGFESEDLLAWTAAVGAI